MRIAGPLLAIIVTFGLVASGCGAGSDDRSDAGGATEAEPAAGDLGQARGAVIANTAGTVTTVGQ